MNKKRPIPEVVDEKKETHTRGCGRKKIDPYHICHRSLFIHPQSLS
jgi:hypothetical protein